MRAVVTGVAGFIGSALAQRLVDEGHRVVGIDALTPYYDSAVKLRNLTPLLRSDNFEWLNEDLLDFDAETTLRGADVIFHQAGEPGVRGSWSSGFDRYVRNNISATQRILDWLTTAKNVKLVYASSSSVYGNAEKWPCREDQEPRPFSPYGVTKLAAEHLVRAYASNYELACVSLRYFTVYGPKQRPDMLMHRLCETFLGRQSIEIYGDGRQVRDFTFVDDIVDANIRAAGLDLPGEQIVLNVCGGSTVSLGEVISILERATGTDAHVVRSPSQPGDVARTGGDNSAARRLLGWEPRTAVEEGLLRQFAWHASTPTD
ncbi:MAG: NAD-dependent epimerase/dehydratase family protein [Mycobacteriaceae bacterium]